jgi:uncharacterized spore protein YtfJ
MDMDKLVAKAGDNLSVGRAFGAAYEKDGMLIIPVAIVFGGGGGGTSRNRQSSPAAGPDDPPEENATPQDSGRTDVGGGFGGLILPSGAYVVKGDQVRWVPAVDVTIAVLASLTLVRLLARTWTRQRRRRLCMCHLIVSDPLAGVWPDRLLGPVQVVRAGREVGLGGPRPLLTPDARPPPQT